MPEPQELSEEYGNLSRGRLLSNLTLLTLLSLSLLPLSSSNTNLSSTAPNNRVTLKSHSFESGGCEEAEKWPLFCSALLNTTLLSRESRERVRERVGVAKEMFCDMIRVLNKIDCAQPFTVSPRWRMGCQEAYRDWSCSLLAEGLMPPSLRSCDSTCHQVIRVCPYLSPDRVQEVDASSFPPKTALHPSQYGGHPAFYCPNSLYDSNSHHSEDYFFNVPPLSSPTPLLTCILFNPSIAGLSPSSFPLTSLNLSNISVTLCEDYSREVEHPVELSGIVNVSSCCWTYNTALPKTYTFLSSTLRRRVESENCVPSNGEEMPNGSNGKSIEFEGEKTIVLQCLVQSIENEVGEENEEEELPMYVDDEGYSSGEDYEDEEEYERIFERGRTTTEAFLSLITATSRPIVHYNSNWRERRSASISSEIYSSSSSSAPRSGLLVIIFFSCLPLLLLLSVRWECRPVILVSRMVPFKFVREGVGGVLLLVKTLDYNQMLVIFSDRSLSSNSINYYYYYYVTNYHRMYLVRSSNYVVVRNHDCSLIRRLYYSYYYYHWASYFIISTKYYNYYYCPLCPTLLGNYSHISNSTTNNSIKFYLLTNST